MMNFISLEDDIFKIITEFDSIEVYVFGIDKNSAPIIMESQGRNNINLSSRLQF